MPTSQTALVTGATSGLGFEAAAQIAERDLARVIITGRTDAKAETARRQLVERTGKDVFETLALDNDDIATVEAAANALAERGGAIDLLILNAGIAPTPKVSMGHDGIERTVSSSLIGHHVLVMRLLEKGLVGKQARIVIAGSEAARGDVPTFNPVDIQELAETHFDGDLSAAVEAQMRMQPPAEYNPSDVYATTKVFVAQWAAELAERLPDGMAVTAVSPGSTPDTNAVRNAPAFMRYLMIPIFKIIPGMSHSVADGAARYLEAADKGTEVSGEFLASAPKKMTGPIQSIELPHITDTQSQKAAWDATTKLAGVGYPSNV